MPSQKASSAKPAPVVDVERFEAVLADIRAGIPLRQALAQRSIESTIFYARLDSSQEDAARYARAKEAQCTAIADEILEIADEAPALTLRRMAGGDELATCIDGAAVQYQRNRIEARKWILSKLVPKVYGDSLQVSGSVGVGLALAINLALPGSLPAGVPGQVIEGEPSAPELPALTLNLGQPKREQGAQARKMREHAKAVRAARTEAEREAERTRQAESKRRSRAKAKARRKLAVE